MEHGFDEQRLRMRSHGGTGDWTTRSTMYETFLPIPQSFGPYKIPEPNILQKAKRQSYVRSHLASIPEEDIFGSPRRLTPGCLYSDGMGRSIMETKQENQAKEGTKEESTRRMKCDQRNADDVVEEEEVKQPEVMEHQATPAFLKQKIIPAPTVLHPVITTVSTQGLTSRLMLTSFLPPHLMVVALKGRRRTWGGYGVGIFGTAQARTFSYWKARVLVFEDRVAGSSTG